MELAFYSGILILCAFTSFIVGRARGYTQGYREAQHIYEKSLADFARAAYQKAPPKDYAPWP